MICLHIFTEEESFKRMVDNVLPKLLSKDAAYKVYVHQGKQDLEHAIRTTIPYISKIPGARILITRDQDLEDCVKLKNRIQNIIRDRCDSPHLIRIVCRQLEAWFLGDLGAVEKAYPRFKSSKYINKTNLQNVDDIQNSDEYLRSILPDYKDRRYLPKLETAEKISAELDITNNSSKSFSHFISGIQKLAGPPSKKLEK
jgi:hypothetical protein